MTKRKKIILLSKYLGVTREQLEDKGVFDSTLGIDTKLFIDSKLLLDSNVPEFSKSKDIILSYFKNLISIHKASVGIPRLQKVAIKMLAIKEPRGLSIGYGQKTDDGTAIPEVVANKILLSATEMLKVGVEDLEIMELLGLFVEDFGPDRISDLTVHIIYNNLCSFTERISGELGLKNLKKFKINDQYYLLPLHPFSDNQIILLPSSLLRKLPVASSWEEVRDAASFNATIRNNYNSIVKKVLRDASEKMTKQTAKELIKSKDDLEKLLCIYRSLSVQSYNLKEDSAGYYNIQPFIEDNSDVIIPTLKPQNNTQLLKSVKELLNQYKRQIEEIGGNKLLYRRTLTGKLIPFEPHREDVAQLLFYGTADLFCNKADIFLSGESDAGRGPVDFSLGTGYKNKIIVEIKKSTNSNLLNGFKKQVKIYEKSENAFHSFYLVIIVNKEVNKKKTYKSNLNELMDIYKERAESGKITPELFIIDGLVYPSASKS